jgi:hypothetical protein
MGSELIGHGPCFSDAGSGEGDAEHDREDRAERDDQPFPARPAARRRRPDDRAAML